MDALLWQASDIDAYGQAVWSCPLDAGVKLRNAIGAATVANKPETPGRARSSRKAIAQGVPSDFGVPVVTTLVCFFVLQTRLWVRRAPGIPCALSSMRDEVVAKPGRKSRRGNAFARNDEGVVASLSQATAIGIEKSTVRFEPKAAQRRRRRDFLGAGGHRTVMRIC